MECAGICCTHTKTIASQSGLINIAKDLGAETHGAFMARFCKKFSKTIPGLSSGPTSSRVLRYGYPNRDSKGATITSRISESFALKSVLEE